MPRVLMVGLLAPALALLTAHAAGAQARPSWQVPRTAHGHPDLQGTWSNASLTKLERPAEFGRRLIMTPQEVQRIEGAQAAAMTAGDQPTPQDAPVVQDKCDVPGWDLASKASCGYNTAWIDPGETVMRVAGQPRTSFITSTPDGRLPPYRSGYKTVRASADREADNPENRSLDERCILNAATAGPVMLPYVYNSNYQIIQTKDDVAILVEMAHDVRHIRLNAKTHLPTQIRPYMGDSIGRWEGDTLVVETTNFPAAQAQAFRGASPELKVIERFKRVAPNRIRYAFTVEDPQTWEQPWSGEYEFSPSKGQMYEYACHEGNYALVGILAGARHEESRLAKVGVVTEASTSRN